MNFLNVYFPIIRCQNESKNWTHTFACSKAKVIFTKAFFVGACLLRTWRDEDIDISFPFIRGICWFICVLVARSFRFVVTGIRNKNHINFSLVPQFSSLCFGYFGIWPCDQIFLGNILSVIVASIFENKIFVIWLEELNSPCVRITNRVQNFRILVQLTQMRVTQNCHSMMNCLWQISLNNFFFAENAFFPFYVGFLVILIYFFFRFFRIEPSWIESELQKAYQ